MASPTHTIGLVLRYISPLIVIILGVAVAKVLIDSRKAPPKADVPAKVLPVELVTARAAENEAALEVFGTVEPRRTVSLRPAVAGPVIFVHPRLLAGERIAEGEVLVRIDPRDFELAVATAEADLITAKANLDVERGNAAVAAREFELLGDSIEVDEATRRLTLREPFVAQREADVRTAEARLEQARINLTRAEVRCPFDALVLTETVEEGTTLTAGAEIATLVERSVFVTEVSVLGSRLDALSGVGSEARIHSGERSYQGRVARVLGEVDRLGRMARVQVEIEDPLGADPPLLLGSYVRVELPMKPLGATFALPRVALREGGVVWLMSENSTLEIKDVDVAMKRRDDVLVAAGLEGGERVVVSAIGVPIPGMALVDADEMPAQGAEGEAETAAAAAQLEADQ